MTVRSTPGNLYDAAANLNYIESELATLMFVLGMDWANISSTTIDDIVTTIRTNYKHVEADMLSYNDGHPATAADDVLKTQNANLTTVARRLWWRRHLASERA